MFRELFHSVLKEDQFSSPATNTAYLSPLHGTVHAVEQKYPIAPAPARRRGSPCARLVIK